MIKKTLMGVLFALSFLSAQAETIRFVPGPYGSTKIITPWGDYAAVFDGSTIWVGTLEELNDIKADAVMRSQGAKRISVEGEASNVRVYVDKDARSTVVANNQLHGITTTIVFGASASIKEKRPPKPVGAEYVNIVWTPSKPTPTKAMLHINGVAVSPNECAGSAGFKYCEFTVLKEQLTKELFVVFYSQGQKPSAIKMDSLAKQHFSDLSLKYKRFKNEPIEKSDVNDLKKLHDLDNSLPSHF